MVECASQETRIVLASSFQYQYLFPPFSLSPPLFDYFFPLPFPYILMSVSPYIYIYNHTHICYSTLNQYRLVPFRVLVLIFLLVIVVLSNNK